MHAVTWLKMFFSPIPINRLFDPVSIQTGGNPIGKLAGNDTGLAIKTLG
jgi:hypothetical protein